MRNGIPLVLVSLAVFGASMSLVYAGDPNPPAGPVTGTMKTLDEVEPRTPVGPDTTPGDADSVYRITAGGSYYLTGNVVAAAGEHGIEIAASDVTLDLNGFHVRGDLNNSLYGIHADGILFSVEIKNGFVFAFNDGGIGGAAGSYVRSRVLDVRVTNTNGVGIAVGTRSTIARCSLDVNAGGNIQTGGSCLIAECVSTNSAGIGIQVGDGSTVMHCVSSFNAEGIRATDACEIISCTANSNAGNGVTVGQDSLVRDTTASSNTGYGIEATVFSQVIDCNADRNTLSGIRAIDRVRVSGCSAGDNKEHGVHITFAGAVEDCFLNNNDMNGIHMDNGGAVTIRDNTVSESVHGIDISAAGGNRIEGNTVTFCSARGIVVTSTGNIVVRNMSGATVSPYSIVGGNVVGPIETGATIGAATNPHGNYQF